MHELVEHDIRVLWDYMLLHQTAGKADCLVMLGGYDDRAAVYAAELTKQFHYWDVMICNGVANDSLLAASRTGATETEHALAAMQRTGFTKQAIPETKAQNIKEGVKLSFDLLRSQNKPMLLSLLVVTMPYMERWVSMLFQVEWPDRDTVIMVSSPHIGLDECITNDHTHEEIISTLVGNMRKIITLLTSSGQSEQALTVDVRAAYDRLIAAGYTKYLVNI